MARVIHVVESYGGGVAAAVTDYALATPELEHALLYAERTDALVSSDLETFFTWKRPLVVGHGMRVAQLRRLMKAEPATTLFHAHSSLAGAYVRLAHHRRADAATAYTPHCYGFERRDLTRPVRGALYAAEKALAALTPGTLIAACSPRELALSQRLNQSSAGVYVPNVAPQTGPVAALRRPQGERPLLVGAGRLSPQKDPDWFGKAVAALRRAGVDVQARWLGGGDAEMEARLRDLGISVSGWLDRGEFVSALAQADLYVHSGLWEGFPITVLEALTAGVPVVVRDVPSMWSFDFPTLAADPKDVIKVLDGLTSGATWEATVAHRDRLLGECSSARQTEALQRLYGFPQTVPLRGDARRGTQ